MKDGLIYIFITLILANFLVYQRFIQTQEKTVFLLEDSEDHGSEDAKGKVFRDVSDVNKVEQIIAGFKYNTIASKDLKFVSQLILKASRLFNLDPALILAVIAVESSFNHRAVSKVQASGLMQLMPATAKSLSRELKIKMDHQKQLYNPYKNIILGSYYLKKLKDRYKSNPKLYITAYNTGPTILTRLLKNSDEIPYPYDRYYKKVSDYYQKFSKINL